MIWVVDFEYRQDNGPDLVGPFPSKEDAELYVLGLDIGDFTAGSRPLVEP